MKYPALSSLAGIYRALSWICIFLGLVAMLCALIAPAVAVDPEPNGPSPLQFEIAVAFVVLSLSLFVSAWRLGISADVVTLRLDVAEYARRSMEALERLSPKK